MKTTAEIKSSSNIVPSTKEADKKIDIDLSVTPSQVDATTVAELLSNSETGTRGLADQSSSSSSEIRTAASFEAGFVRRIDPAVIRLMPMPNRDPSAFETDEFEDLRIAILSNGGNTVPISVVELDEKRTDGGFQYELVSGERRLMACKSAKLPVLAYVQKAAHLLPTVRPFETIRENQAREALSPYEFGRQLKFVVDAGHVSSIRRLGREIGRDPKDINDGIKLACLPIEVINAFVSTWEIQFRYQAPLTQAVKENSEAVLQMAKEICAQPERPNGKVVFQRLIKAAQKTSMTAEIEGEGPSATPAKGLLHANGKEVGRVLVDGKKRAKIMLSPELTDKQQDALYKHMAAFVKRHFGDVAAPAQAVPVVLPSEPADSTKELTA